MFWDAYIKQVQEMGVISGMNGVAVARHGPILWENEATPSGKLSKYLPGPPGLVFGPKTTKKIENPKNPYIYLREFVRTHVILTPGARGREGPSSS